MHSKIDGVLFGCHDHTWERFWSILGFKRARAAHAGDPIIMTSLSFGEVRPEGVGTPSCFA
jgi:hypothetical protein